MRGEAGAGLGSPSYFLGTGPIKRGDVAFSHLRIEHEPQRALVKGSVGTFLGKTAGDDCLATIGVALKGAALGQNHESEPSGVGRLPEVASSINSFEFEPSREPRRRAGRIGVIY